MSLLPLGVRRACGASNKGQGKGAVMPPAFQESCHRFGDFEIDASEDAQEPGRTKHEGKAEPIMGAPQPVDDLSIASVQMEIPRQLVSGRSGGKIGIALPLLIGQVSRGQIVRNLGLLRRAEAAQKTRDIFLAKHLCGSQYFSNMFCNAGEARS